MSDKTIHNQYSDETFRRVSKSAYLAAVSLLLLVPTALLVDIPIAKAVLKGRFLPGDIYRLVNFSEVFAHGAGVAVLCVLIYVLDPYGRRLLLRVTVCTFGAGLLANVVKLTVARRRPHAFLHQDNSGLGNWDTFVTWIPHFSQLPDPGSHTIQSFPSAHTATAVAFAFTLAWRYPRGRWLFAVFACMAACQRIVVNAHYLSDTLAGAAVGALMIGVGFDRRIARRFQGLRNRETATRDNAAPQARNAA